MFRKLLGRKEASGNEYETENVDNFIGFELLSFFKSIIQEASETYPQETLERFFVPNLPFITGYVNFADEKIRSTCDFRNENLPRYPRMRNVHGNLVYVGQRSNQEQKIKAS